MPVNNLINYSKEFSDFNSIFNVKNKNVENMPVIEESVNSMQNKNSVNNLNVGANMNMNLNNINNMSNINNNLINMIAAQRIFNSLSQQNLNNSQNKEKTQGNIKNYII